MVPLDDRGLLLGDGLFETLLWKDGALVLAGAHAARMAAAARELGLPAPDALRFVGVCAEAVRAAGLDAARAAVRVTLTAGSGGRGLERPADLKPQLFATATPSAPPTGPARLHIAATVRRNAASPTSRMKTLSYLDNVLARREAVAAGAGEAVLLNTDGVVAGAAAANLFWISDDRLFTPAAAAGRLEGVMARQVCTAASTLGVAVEEVMAGPEALASADALFLTNSLIGIRPASLRASPVRSHPLVERLAGQIAPVA